MTKTTAAEYLGHAHLDDYSIVSELDDFGSVEEMAKKTVEDAAEADEEILDQSEAEEFIRAAVKRWMASKGL